MEKSITWIPKNINVSLKDEVTKENLADYILKIKKDDINYDFMMSTFGLFEGKSLARPYDLLEVPVGAFTFIDYDKTKKSNTNEFTTTMGLWIFNQIVTGFNFTKLFGYINTPINSKGYKKIEKRLAWAVIEDDITTEDLKEWENTMQWLMPFEDVLSPNHSEKMISCTKAIDKKKAELIKKYKKELDAGDIKVADEMEKELLAFARDYLKDDECIDTIDSGAGTSFGNNFKNMYVMRGAIYDPDPNAKQKYKIATSSYLDGVTPDEYSIVSNVATLGAYSRGKKTENGGYWEKLFVSAYQHINLDPLGSDCGTKRHITVALTENNINDYMYSYVIKPNGDLELINSKTRDKYIGKTVNLRFASMCESKTGICNKCAGDLLYIGATNIGVAMAQIPDRLKNICMKNFHDATIHTSTMDPMKAFYPFEN